MKTTFDVNDHKRSVKLREWTATSGRPGYRYRARVRIGDKVYFAHVRLIEFRDAVKVPKKPKRPAEYKKLGEARLLAMKEHCSLRTAYRRLSRPKELPSTNDSNQPLVIVEQS